MAIKNILFLPVLIQVTLSFYLLFRLGYLRIQLLKSGQIKIRDIALGQKIWPDKVIKTENSFNNQFEMPILFFLVVLLALHFDLSSLIFVGLAFLFSISRLMHSAIHIGNNNVNLRFMAFVVGFIVLISMWIHLAVHVIF